MIRRVFLLAVMFLIIGIAEAAEWKPVPPIQGTTAPQTLMIKGKPSTYHRAAGLRLNVTGPGSLRVISRWVGPRPAGRDTSYSLTIVGGTKKVHATLVSRKSPIAGVPGQRQWVSRSRTQYATVPPRTTQITLACSDKNVFVKVLFNKKPHFLGTLAVKSPDKYAEVVRLDRQEREVKYYRATSQVPVELDVIGPTTLVMYSRLEFTYEMKGVQNYQVQVLERDQVVNSYTWSAVRSDVAKHLDRDDLVPSAGKRCMIRVPAGTHRLVFKPGSALDTVLLRFLIPVKDI